ncbi:response regulator [Sagittula sp. S175]|uniref:response regulator n=1 Tax=Sagittula sp. S175 TaxID=3415129 RepID=UPI003C7E5CF0
MAGTAHRGEKSGERAGERALPGSCLVVDDNSFDRCLVRRCLGRDRPELELFEVDSIGAARAFLTRRTPDMILLDHRLPDGQGASFARELRMNATLDDTIICVVTNADTRLLDPDVPAMSKEDLTPQTLWSLVDDFLEERRVAQGTVAGKLVSDFGGVVQDNMSGAVARMLRTLRRARTAARRSIPRAAMNDLDQLEEMLLALSEVAERRS